MPYVTIRDDGRESFETAQAMGEFRRYMKRPLPKRPRYEPAKTEIAGARVIAKPGVAEIFGWAETDEIRIIREQSYPGQRGPITAGSFWVARVAPEPSAMTVLTLGSDVVLYTED